MRPRIGGNRRADIVLPAIDKECDIAVRHLRQAISVLPAAGGAANQDIAPSGSAGGPVDPCFHRQRVGWCERCALRHPEI